MPPADPDDPRFRAYFQSLATLASAAGPHRNSPWSPDGTKLAYPCGTGTAQTLGGSTSSASFRANGSGHTEIHTPTGASWPSWSADGKRIFMRRPSGRKTNPPSTASGSMAHIERCSRKTEQPPPRRPTDNTIAYQTACGIRLVTPAGTDITPHPTRKAATRWAVRSARLVARRETRIAFETRGHLRDEANGTQLRLVSHKATFTWYGQLPSSPPGAPYLKPTVAAADLVEGRHRSRACADVSQAPRVFSCPTTSAPNSCRQTLSLSHRRGSRCGGRDRRAARSAYSRCCPRFAAKKGMPPARIELAHAV